MRKQSDRSVIFLLKLIILFFISQMAPISGVFAASNFNINLNIGVSNDSALPPDKNNSK